jgi:hypothetical protein
MQQAEGANDSGTNGNAVPAISGETNALPANMVALFQQFLASVAKSDEGKGAGKKEVKEDSAKTQAVKEVPKKDKAESSAQGEARANINKPFCHRCLTRGHPKEECVEALFCEICESSAHVKGRCPLLKKARSLYAMTCGYAVDGLGFYYIPHSAPSRPRAGVKTTLIHVTQGKMNAGQIKGELERLVSSKHVWEVQEVVQDKFKTVFLTLGELRRMIEWGTLETKN